MILKKKTNIEIFLKHRSRAVISTWLFNCETTRLPDTLPMPSFVNGQGSYCEATRFPGTIPMHSIAEGWGSYYLFPLLIKFYFYISLSKLNIENTIKAIDIPVLTVFLTLTSFKNILEIKITTLIIKKITLTLYFKSIYSTSVKHRLNK